MYKKHIPGVWPAIICILVYCILPIGIPPEASRFWTIAFLAVCAILISVYVKVTGLSGRYGLSSWPKNSRRFLYLIPLWVLTSANLWGGIAIHSTMQVLVWNVISMMLVGYIEEMLFRGFLFTAVLESDGIVTATLVSSQTFALGHIVNLFTGQGTFGTVIQMAGAFCLGFLYTVVYYRTKSLWPCIISHALVDIFGYFENFGMVMSWVIVGSVILISVGYGLFLLKLPAESVDSNRTAEKKC